MHVTCFRLFSFRLYKKHFPHIHICRHIVTHFILSYQSIYLPVCAREICSEHRAKWFISRFSAREKSTKTYLNQHQKLKRAFLWNKMLKSFFILSHHRRCSKKKSEIWEREMWKELSWHSTPCGHSERTFLRGGELQKKIRNFLLILKFSKAQF